MNFKLKVAYNTLIQLAGRLFTGLITYGVTLILVRQYGPLGFGDFVKILTFVSYFYIMGDFGFNAIVVKKISVNEKDSLLYLSNLLGLRLILSLFLIFLSLAILSFLPQGYHQGFTPIVRLGIIIGSLTILTQSMLTTTNAWFQKTLRYDKSVLATSLGYILTLLLAYLFARAQSPIAFLAIPYVLGGIFSVTLSFLLLEIKFSPSFNWEIWQTIIFPSLPLGLTFILNLVYFKADSFILTLTRSTLEVGIYGLAYKFFELCLVFPTFFMNSLYPVFLHKQQNEKSEFLPILKNSGFILLGISLLITAVVLFLAPYLINFTSGKNFADFSGAILALRILAMGLPFFFVSSFLMWLLVTNDKQKLLVPFYGFSMLLNIILNLIFIPQFGYLAAAVTTGVSEAVVMLLLLIPSMGLLKNSIKQ